MPSIATSPLPEVSVTVAVTRCSENPGSELDGGASAIEAPASPIWLSASTASRSKPGCSPLTYVMRTAVAKSRPSEARSMSIGPASSEKSPAETKTTPSRLTSMVAIAGASASRVWTRMSAPPKPVPSKATLSTKATITAPPEPPAPIWTIAPSAAPVTFVSGPSTLPVEPVESPYGSPDASAPASVSARPSIATSPIRPTLVIAAFEKTAVLARTAPVCRIRLLPACDGPRAARRRRRGEVPTPGNRVLEGVCDAIEYKNRAVRCV